MKQCKLCGEDKPLDMFGKDKWAKDGRVGKCRPCRKAVAAEWWQRQGREYRASIADKEKSRGKAYYAAHREERLAYYKANYDPRRKAIVGRAYREATADHQRTRHAEYSKTHKDQGQEKAHRRRARLVGQFVENVNVGKLATRDRWICGICGGKVAKGSESIDHIVPISQGGEHSYRNTQLAHIRCNKARGARGPSQIRLLA